MGHKRVFNIITSQCINGQWGIADVAFSITSKQKAQEQMDTIRRLTERGEWFVGSDHTTLSSPTTSTLLMVSLAS